LGQLDDKKLSMAIDKGFGFFDKDKSGFIEGAEASEAAQKVLNMAGGPAKVSSGHQPWLASRCPSSYRRCQAPEVKQQQEGALYRADKVLLLMQ
jgi:hypothetical protein